MPTTRITSGCCELAFDEWEDNQESDAAATGDPPGVDSTSCSSRPSACPMRCWRKVRTFPRHSRPAISEHGETLRPDLVVRNPEGVPNAGQAPAAGPGLSARAEPRKADLAAGTGRHRRPPG